MNGTILTTKLHVPQARPDLLVRQRLLQQVDEGLQPGYRVILVAAPAGFGKTTLLGQWAGRHSRHLAWLSLDEADADPARFWTYAIAALATVRPGIGEAALATLRAQPPIPIVNALDILINDLSERIDPCVLVLDDYHLCATREVDDSLAYFIEHLPSQVRLVIATRVDPPLPLPRLRARRELMEIRAADLQFQPAEAEALLRQVMALPLTESDVAMLAAQTEGWIAGLQMAALSLRGRDARQASAFVATFSGTHHYVLDYLLQEVLEQQPKPVQDFLLVTAGLDRLSAPLCNAVTGRSDGREMLDRLETANLFLEPLDQDRHWYRYHRLFAELLRVRAEDADPGRLGQVRHRASLWHEQEGLIPEAAAYAMAGGDMDRLASLVETYGEALLNRGELGLLLAWFTTLPSATIAARPRLAVNYAWSLLLSGRLSAVETCLLDAERALANAPDADLTGQVAAIRAYSAALQGEVPVAIRLAQLAREQLDADNLTVRSVVAFVLGGACFMQGDLEGMADAMVQTVELAQPAGNIHLVSPALTNLAGVQHERGQLRQAETTCREALRLVTTTSGEFLPMAGGPLSQMADLHYEWNDLEGALGYAEQGVQRARQWGNADSLAGACLTLAQVRRARGDLTGSRTALDETAHLLARQTAGPQLVSLRRAQEALWWLVAGNPSRAEEQLAGLQGDYSPLASHEWLATAQVRLAQGQADEALRVLQPLLAGARLQGRITTLIRGLALETAALVAKNDHPAAQAAWSEATALAKPEGYIRPFLDAGLPAQPAGRAGIADFGLVPSSAASMPGLQPASAAGSRPGTRNSPAIGEALSPREFEVLRLIAAGLSNHEIAARLYVTESTVKSHVNTILRKLDVKRRMQAVSQARELGLL